MGRGKSSSEPKLIALSVLIVGGLRYVRKTSWSTSTPSCHPQMRMRRPFPCHGGFDGGSTRKRERRTNGGCWKTSSIDFGGLQYNCAYSMIIWYYKHVYIYIYILYTHEKPWDLMKFRGCRVAYINDRSVWSLNSGPSSLGSRVVLSRPWPVPNLNPQRMFPKNLLVLKDPYFNSEDHW